MNKNHTLFVVCIERKKKKKEKWLSVYAYAHFCCTNREKKKKVLSIWNFTLLIQLYIHLKVLNIVMCWFHENKMMEQQQLYYTHIHSRCVRNRTRTRTHTMTLIILKLTHKKKNQMKHWIKSFMNGDEFSSSHFTIWFVYFQLNEAVGVFV